MDIASTTPQPTTPAASPATGSRAAKLKKVAGEMEAVWIAQILKETRPKGGMMDKSFASQTFQDMLGQQLAQDMAKKGVLGLADQLIRQLSPTLEKAGETGTAPQTPIEGAS